MKSLAMFFTSKKRDKDRLHSSSATVITSPTDTLFPPEPQYGFTRPASPATTMYSVSSGASSRPSAKSVLFGTRREAHSGTLHPQQQQQRPALSRAFFRSATDVSKVIPLTSKASATSITDDVMTTAEIGYIRRDVPHRVAAASTHPITLSASASSSSSNVDPAYDPFASIYRAPSPAHPKRRTSPPASPPRLLPKLPKVDPVPTTTQPRRARARAVSFGSAIQQPACPASTLGPLPPLPTPSPSPSPPNSDAVSNSTVPNSAPPQTITFGSVNRTPKKRASTSSVVQGSSPRTSLRSSRRPSTAESSGGSPKRLITVSSHGNLTTSVSLGSMTPPRAVPQLDLTWARFLSEVQEDSEIIALRTSASVPAAQPVAAGAPPALPPRSRARAAPPRLPPPDRPLPVPPVAPLNIRRNRAQTMTATTRPLLALTLNRARRPEFHTTNGVFTPPVSPAAINGHQPFFDNILDVVVTPAPTTTEHQIDDAVNNLRLNSRPGTPATSSSLPYLSSSPSQELVVATMSRGSKHAKTPSGSTADWDACSRTVSEMSLSMFPAPPSGPSSSSLSVPIQPMLSALHELPTPPITPSHAEFSTGMLYSAEAASRSTSTIRAHRLSIRTSTPTPGAPEEEFLSEESSDASVTSHTSGSGATAWSSQSSYIEDDDFTTSGTTICSDSSASDDSVVRSSCDTDRSDDPLPSPVVALRVGKAPRPTWLDHVQPPSPPSHSQGKDRFGLLPNFYFDPTFAEPPSTPLRTRASVVARREQLLTSLGGNQRLDATRSPGSPFAGRVEWGEAL